MQYFRQTANAILCGVLVRAAVLTTDAQSGVVNPPVPTVPVTRMQPEVLNLEALAEQGKALLEKAKAGSGSSGITLSDYNGHYTMLTARTKSGGGELHKHFADFLIVVDGEGTELTGGTMLNAKELPGGEVRGTGLEGATPHVLHKGVVSPGWSIHAGVGTKSYGFCWGMGGENQRYDDMGPLTIAGLK